MNSSKLIVLFLTVLFTFGCKDKLKIKASQNFNLPVQKLDFDTVEIDVDFPLTDIDME